MQANLYVTFGIRGHSKVIASLSVVLNQKIKKEMLVKFEEKQGLTP